MNANTLMFYFSLVETYEILCIS